MNTETTVPITTSPQKVYTLETHEPLVTRIDEILELPVLYATREAAEQAAADYNETFNDEEPAIVRELEVNS